MTGHFENKACLLSCGGEAHFVPSECRVANRKAVRCTVYCWYCNAEHLPKNYPVFKICGMNNIPSLSEYTKVHFKFKKKQNSLSVHIIVHLRMSAKCDSLHLKTVNFYKFLSISILLQSLFISGSISATPVHLHHRNNGHMVNEGMEQWTLHRQLAFHNRI